MKEWIAMHGDFEKEGNKIRFIGGYYNNLNQNKDNVKVTKNGLLLFDDLFFNGSIEMKAEFEEIDSNDEIQIIFNYNDEKDFSCIGLTNNTFKYEFKHFDGKWNYDKVAGSTVLKSKDIYRIKVDVVGSVVTLYINNVKIFNSYAKDVTKIAGIGIWAKSSSSIIIHDFKANYDKPKAFVVMQFGKNYDDLYQDVIKPICEEKGYEVYRADENMQTGLIIKDIIDSIQNSAIIIADITPDNPNVFYEVGFSHALKKPTILLHEKGKRDKLPFDVSGFRTIFYDNSIGGKKEVEEKLENFIISINASTPGFY